MRHDDDERDEQDAKALDALGRRVAIAHDTLVDRPAVLAEARARLARRPHGSRAPRVLAGGLVLAAAAAAVFVLRPLGLSIDGQARRVNGENVAESGWVTAGETASTARFSEGSTLRVEPGGSVRVIGRDARGAHVSVERGGADLDLRPGLFKRWEIDAGPFQITGAAAQLHVEWHPESGEARVRVTAGSVRIVSPCGAPKTLVPGDDDAFRCGSPREEQAREPRPTPSSRVAEVADAAPAPPVDAQPAPLRPNADDRAEPHAVVRRATIASIPPGPAPTTTSSPREVLAVPTLPLPPPVSSAPVAPSSPKEPSPGEVASPAASTASPPHAPPAWRDLVMKGDYAGSLTMLGPEGVASVLTAGSEDDVAVLADACRFTGQTEPAQRALSTLRRRFPASQAARTASFHLGRLALDKQASPATAAIWFKKYLAEAPSGALSEEARGLLFQAEQRAGDLELAAEHARDYLVRYPAGPYRRAAEAVLAKP
jgi:hypothetical protein